VSNIGGTATSSDESDGSNGIFLARRITVAMYQKIWGCALLICCYALPVGANNNSKFTAQDLNKIVTEAQTWKGIHYRYGGTDKRGIDCSHFVYAIYSRIFTGHAYRRSDDYLAKDPEFTATAKPQAGDVIVFPSVNGLSGHVGILTNVRDTKFIGSQSSTGVRETSYAPHTYWGKRPYKIMSLIKS
jgi:cell wall-associated NlpC family hydrolase